MRVIGSTEELWRFAFGAASRIVAWKVAGIKGKPGRGVQPGTNGDVPVTYKGFGEIRARGSQYKVSRLIGGK
jgi:hypothetical protein